MPRDSFVFRGDPHVPGRPTAGWRIWLTSARHVGVAALGVVLVGVLFGYLLAAMAIFPAHNAASDLQSVPRLIGKTAAEAQKALDRLGFSMEVVASVHHPEASEGTVLAQDPLPRQRLSAGGGSAVTVTLSLGPQQRPVLEVVGLAHGQAETALKRAGFETELLWVDAEAIVGQVVGTQPTPGTPVKLPGQVRLVVSAGPPAVAVPDLITRSTVEAKTVLERLGLELGSFSQDSTSLAAPGTVIDQRPSAGTVVSRGTRVSVTVAILPPPIVDTTSTRQPAGSDSVSNGDRTTG